MEAALHPTAVRVELAAGPLRVMPVSMLLMLVAALTFRVRALLAAAAFAKVFALVLSANANNASLIPMQGCAPTSERVLENNNKQ